MEQRAEKKTNVRSLKYCSDAVERLFAEWSTANVGKEKEVAGSEEVSYSDHIQVRIEELEKVSERLPKALYETVQAIIAELSALDISGDKNVEEKLESLDRRLDQSIFDNIETIKTAQIETAVASQTSGLDLNSENTDQAYQRIFCREVRRTHGLPVLSLYGL
ncbi:MAG: hypothetical protein HKN33_00115 [Pyrinomonadaceae bacterium]|nr:hypothetical protein [Pyrinomonadaceae bacterium]